jgi:hypothetical protein
MRASCLNKVCQAAVRHNYQHTALYSQQMPASITSEQTEMGNSLHLLQFFDATTQHPLDLSYTGPCAGCAARCCLCCLLLHTALSVVPKGNGCV